MSSVCNDAHAVKAFTTVAEVIAMQTAAAWSSRTAMEGLLVTRLGRIVRKTSPKAQLLIPRPAIFPSPTLDMARRTYPPCRRALIIPMEPMSAPFCLLFQSNTSWSISETTHQNGN